ncbi:MAG: YbjQ family protein [Bradymonadia bacterium]
MSERALIKGSDGAVTGFKSPVLVVTTDEVPGQQVTQVLGLVRGNSIRARHVGRDIMAGFKNLFGGEIADYTKMLAQSREQALDRMIDQARSMGANAVVGVRFTSSTVMQGAAEMVAYGTAVQLG